MVKFLAQPILIESISKLYDICNQYELISGRAFGNTLSTQSRVILELKFELDNPLRTEISKLVKVVWVKNRIVGAHYMETKLYEKDLGFYLQT